MQTYDDAVSEALAVVEEPVPLTADDRCDRCGARAQQRVQLKTGELLFCGHHYTEHSAKLAELVQIPRAL